MKGGKLEELYEEIFEGGGTLRFNQKNKDEKLNTFLNYLFNNLSQKYGLSVEREVQLSTFAIGVYFALEKLNTKNQLCTYEELRLNEEKRKKTYGYIKKSVTDYFKNELLKETGHQIERKHEGGQVNVKLDTMSRYNDAGGDILDYVEVVQTVNNEDTRTSIFNEVIRLNLHLLTNNDNVEVYQKLVGDFNFNDYDMVTGDYLKQHNLKHSDYHNMKNLMKRKIRRIILKNGGFTRFGVTAQINLVVQKLNVNDELSEIYLKQLITQAKENEHLHKIITRGLSMEGCDELGRLFHGEVDVNNPTPLSYDTVKVVYNNLLMFDQKVQKLDERLAKIKIEPKVKKEDLRGFALRNGYGYVKS